jgi:excisionase family DNA binding protein
LNVLATESRSLIPNAFAIPHDATDLPRVLGEVERLRAELWAALYAAATRRATTPSNDVGFFTVTEVAKKLQFSRGHVYELVRQGRLRVIRSGRSVRVPVAALNELDTIGIAKAVDPEGASIGRWNAGGRTGGTGINSEAEARTSARSASPRRGRRRK